MIITNLLKFMINSIIRIIGSYYYTISIKKYRISGIFLSKALPSKFAKCGKNFKVYGNPTIFDPEKIYIGDNFTINGYAQLSPRGNIYIGNNVTMSRGSQITAGELNTAEWKQKRLNETLEHIEGDVYIGDGTWLCVNSIVLPGVQITGKGVIVAAGAIVTHDITEDFVIVGGIPAKIIKHL